MADKQHGKHNPADATRQTKTETRAKHLLPIGNIRLGSGTMVTEGDSFLRTRAHARSIDRASQPCTGRRVDMRRNI